MARRKVSGIKIDDYSAQVLKAMRTQVQNGLNAVGQTCEKYAKAGCPVDTGRLRNSITYATKTKHDSGSFPAEGEDFKKKAEPKENSVYIGTNVSYASVQEYGDFSHKVGNKHFLKNAASNHSEEYKAIIKAALKS